MLRRLEKGLNSAKQKSNMNDSLTLPPLVGTSSADGRFRDNGGPSGSHYTGPELPPLNLPSHMQEGYARSNQTSDSEMDEDEEDDQKDGGMYPARVIKQNSRNSSFFKTILNPADEAPVARSSGASERSFSQNPPSPHTSAQPSTSVASLFADGQTLKDPVEAGLLAEDEVINLWDMFYLRLNPFINLFDPALHTYSYVRSKCPFLFTAFIMACCKFFKPEMYQPVLRLAHQFAVRAFAENWKRVEVVQAFACMTYWKEPDDTRTWTYIGYACRMAIELGLNRYAGRRPAGESEPQMLERRNRERTYLVLWVHDRSLSMQTGKHWMLPKDDELVRRSGTWHEEGGAQVRQEDVIVSAFTQLRGIAANTTDIFNMAQGGSMSSGDDVDYEVLLRDCNSKLNQWVQTWREEMKRAGGSVFHISMLMFFQLHVRLFLNTFGIHSNSSSPSCNVEALNACYHSAISNLKLVAHEFVDLQMLRYGQDSITVMTAYSAVVLLKLLRADISPSLLQRKPDAMSEIHSVITMTAKAYNDAAHLSHQSYSAAYHARFLQSLIANDVQKERQRQAERERYAGVNGRAASSPYTPVGHSANGYGQQMYGAPVVQANGVDHPHAHQHNGYYAQSPTAPSSTLSSSAASSSSSPYSHPATSSSYIPHREQDYAMSDSTQRGGGMGSFSLAGISTTYAQYQAQPMAEHDALYWRNMFKDLGFDGGAEPQQAHPQTQAPTHTYANGAGYVAPAGALAEAGASAVHMQQPPAHPAQQQQQPYGGVTYREAPAEHAHPGYQSHGGYTGYVTGYTASYGR
ncbi:hypothetical protein EVJ58_g2615 [Rhodofomes roseus]|uniref:Xylanolytic transcriptional activator regulatory domain-containing protein n=1 Tax=Rhodofomes roseus TaxID=34475 RepID=A0A4Y9YTM5_9APHY|nr:hypothetical protein EVJ58_g2615 [Rhodofomes roseus]